MRVLVVEDERKVADALRDGFEAECYEVAVERTGEGAFYRSTTEAFDLIVLDLGLPGRDGLEILAALRQRRIAIPVIVLTARDSVEDRVSGLDTGADDYLIKPFAFAELLARTRALLRRGGATDTRLLTVGAVSVDASTRTAMRDGNEMSLTGKEFDLLAALMRYEGQVVSRETLAREVWHEPGRSTSLDNVIDVHMARLRRKVDSDESSRLIHTVRGVGFTMRIGEP